MILNIPGYAEAVQREGEIRDRAFLPLPEIVGGLECLPFTPYHFLILDQARSPFLMRADCSVDSILTFFWVASPSFIPGRTFRSRFRRFICDRKTYRTIKGRPVIETVREIQEYLSQSFQDSPGSSGSDHVPYVSHLAAYVDCIASDYGWTEEYILSRPFKKLFQYIKRIHQRADPGVPKFNPSDRIKNEWLIEENARLRKIAELEKELNIGTRNGEVNHG